MPWKSVLQNDFLNYFYINNQISTKFKEIVEPFVVIVFNKNKMYCIKITLGIWILLFNLDVAWVVSTIKKLSKKYFYWEYSQKG